MTTFDEYLQERFAEDPEFKRGYDRLGPLYDLIADVLRLRHTAGLTQAQLAARMGKQQPAIARFESGNVTPTLTYLQDLAEALGAKLVVRLEPLDIASQAVQADPPAKTSGAAKPPRRRRKAVSA